MSLKDHYSPKKFRSVVVKLSDLYDRHRLTDVEVTSQLLDFLGFNPEMVEDMFDGVSAEFRTRLWNWWRTETKLGIAAIFRHVLVQGR